MINRKRFILLLDNYVANRVTPEERSELFEAISSGEHEDWLIRDIDQQLQATDIEGANLPPHRSAAILHKIISSEKQNQQLLPTLSRRTLVTRWVAAAAIFGAILLGVYFIAAPGRSTTQSPAVAKNLVTKTNGTTEPLRIAMEDGSVITLQPGSAIHYPRHFAPARREVFLDGEAFFEVSKNPNRPFYVFNRNIVTHVLGTSFTVRVNKNSKQVEVLVRSGRVEVYENNETRTAAAQKNNGVILLPNQKVVYDEQARQFVPSLVDKPLPLLHQPGEESRTATVETIFEETPLKQVLPWLEKTYGVEIVVENEALYQCLFTGDINQQDLYTRLDVLCQATGASYEIKGTRILVKGKGCY